MSACDFDQKIENGKVQISAPGENKFLDVALVKCDKGYGPSQQNVKYEASGKWQHATCTKLPSDCKEALDVFPGAESGQYKIELWKSGKILTVNCDMETEGGGWTIFHRRMDGSVIIYRNFTEYENGFGNLGGELYLVLDADSKFAYNNQMPFSTYDRELDVQFNWNCAVIRHGAWWYHACTIVNLNGKYLTPGSSS
ncbi:fibrinogen alpha chain-like, partial [Ruditapes philippinarum]|uniref:fibrinogen alpha chain-like n=1 Tax=Ruditapes philippinarum TaxID=129788 RepID=UPI00295B1AB5